MYVIVASSMRTGSFATAELINRVIYNNTGKNSTGELTVVHDLDVGKEDPNQLGSILSSYTPPRVAKTHLHPDGLFYMKYHKSGAIAISTREVKDSVVSWYYFNKYKVGVDKSAMFIRFKKDNPTATFATDQEEMSFMVENGYFDNLIQRAAEYDSITHNPAINIVKFNYVDLATYDPTSVANITARLNEIATIIGSGTVAQVDVDAIMAEMTAQQGQGNGYHVRSGAVGQYLNELSAPAVTYVDNKYNALLNEYQYLDNIAQSNFV